MENTREPFSHDITEVVQLTEYPQSYWDLSTPSQRVLLAQMEMWKKKCVESQVEIQELKAKLAIAEKFFTNFEEDYCGDFKVNGFTSKQRESITVDNNGLVYVNGIQVCDCNNDLCATAEDYYCRAYCAYHSDEEDHNG